MGVSELQVYLGVDIGVFHFLWAVPVVLVREPGRSLRRAAVCSQLIPEVPLGSAGGRLREGAPHLPRTCHCPPRPSSFSEGSVTRMEARQDGENGDPKLREDPAHPVSLVPGKGAQVPGSCGAAPAVPRGGVGEGDNRLAPPPHSRSGRAELACGALTPPAVQQGQRLQGTQSARPKPFSLEPPATLPALPPHQPWGQSQHFGVPLCWWLAAGGGDVAHPPFLPPFL